MDNNLLNIKEASEYLNVCQDTLRKWDRSGKLVPITTVGRLVALQKRKQIMGLMWFYWLNVKGQ